ncbi:clathrin heavy chain 1-like [Dysidea avara]|uniref:clathrin heavy chain 1-like n=1 Tax=Dysidea avara TaxID=196820 RepID=UPI003322E98A
MAANLKALQLAGIKETKCEIGAGAYTRVLEVYYCGTSFAAKQIQPSARLREGPQRTKDNYVKECQLCIELRHPNIIQFIGIYHSSDSSLPVMVLEYMNESLTAFLKRCPNVPLATKMSILLDTSLGLRYLHCQTPPIVHGGLSSDNILLTAQQVAKIDVSSLVVAKVVDIESKKSQLGTVDFLPSSSTENDMSLDIFSFGAVTLHVATQQWPTPESTMSTEVERRQCYIDQMETGCMEELRSLVMTCLDDDPVQRPTIMVISETVKEIKQSSMSTVTCSVEHSSNLTNNVVLTLKGSIYSIGTVEEAAKKEHARLLQPWLESLVKETVESETLHTALAKVYIDSSSDPDQFLRENKFYDSKLIEKHHKKEGSCTKSEQGNGDAEDSPFKTEACDLVKQGDINLWTTALDPSNPNRKQLIDQVIETAIFQTDDAEKASVAVKAFMMADLPNELVELLEKMILGKSAFADNRNLQNLLILTAIKADQSRVMKYIDCLDNFDAPDIANIAISTELYEEAFAIFKKQKVNSSAIDVLIAHIDDMSRASEFAEQCDELAVWSVLARAQLNKGMVKESIDSYIKADDASASSEVIEAAKGNGNFMDLVRYLQMARKKSSDDIIGRELAYALEKIS